MTFTNVSNAGVYMLCCHREVEPGGSFVLPWLEAKDCRPLRLAMEDGTFAWESGKDEPTVPGSPDPKAYAKRKAAYDKRVAEAKAKEEAEIAKKRIEDEEAVKRNMAGMGDFKVPMVTDFKVQARKQKTEKPITKADVIKSNEAPKSLADIRRHNRAVRQQASEK